MRLKESDFEPQADLAGVSIALDPVNVLLPVQLWLQTKRRHVAITFFNCTIRVNVVTTVCQMWSALSINLHLSASGEQQWLTIPVRTQLRFTRLSGAACR